MAEKDSVSLNINLIAKKQTHWQKIIQAMALYGLIATGLITVVVIGLVAYKFSLQKKLAAINVQADQVAKNITNQAEFEKEFLLVQEKLTLYQELIQNEKMEDLFPKLSALIPEGVQVRDLIIEPDRVEMVCFVTDQTVLTHFVNNLNLANQKTFEDGQKLEISNTYAREIVKNNESSFSNYGYNFSLSFDYMIS